MRCRKCGLVCITAATPAQAGVIQSKEPYIMLLGIFQGQNYSYSLDTDTGEYFLFKNDYKAHAILKGKDARIFARQLDHLDTLPEPQYKTGLMTENLIKLLVS
jgi:hypothetical protein